MKPILYIMCGAPSSGKSTWAKNFVNESSNDVKYISRDEIRFSLLKNGEPYFLHEKEVYKKFVNAISQALTDNNDVIADATHLNFHSRFKLFNALHTKGIEFNTICVCCVTELHECIERNMKRSGRARVPDEVLKDMYNNLDWPTIDEDESIKEIWAIRS